MNEAAARRWGSGALGTDRGFAVSGTGAAYYGGADENNHSRLRASLKPQPKAQLQSRRRPHRRARHVNPADSRHPARQRRSESPAQGDALGTRPKPTGNALKGRNFRAGLRHAGYLPFRACQVWGAHVPRALPWADEWMRLWRVVVAWCISIPSRAPSGRAVRWVGHFPGSPADGPWGRSSASRDPLSSSRLPNTSAIGERSSPSPGLFNQGRICWLRFAPQQYTLCG